MIHQWSLRASAGYYDQHFQKLSNIPQAAVMTPYQPLWAPNGCCIMIPHWLPWAPTH